MWVKLVIGAVAGLIIGHFVTPGYALWVVLGIIFGYLVDLGLGKKAKEQESEAR